MVKQLWLIVLASLISIGNSQLGYAETKSAGQSVYNTVSESIFTIFSIDEDNKNKSALGSAVAITDNLLATNCHVALAGNYLIVEVNKKPFLGKLFYYNQIKDLCIVEITGTKINPVKIRPSKTTDIGEEIYAIGNPKGLEKTISRGIISNKEIKNGVLIKLQTDAAISHGSSGGGLFDSKGNLIGITTSGKQDAENIGFAIPTELILDTLDPKSTNKTTDSEKITEKLQPITLIKQPFSNMDDNTLTRIGNYGNSEIGLMRWQEKCFITITGRDKSNLPKSIAIWFPHTANGLFIFSRVINVENVIKFLKWINERKNVKYVNSKSYIFFDKKLIPLILISVDNVNQPVYIFPRKTDLTEDLIELDYFLGQFYGYSQNSGMTTIKFSLDGFTEALSGYNKYCDNQE